MVRNINSRLVISTLNYVGDAMDFGKNNWYRVYVPLITRTVTRRNTTPSKLATSPVAFVPVFCHKIRYHEYVLQHFSANTLVRFSLHTSAVLTNRSPTTLGYCTGIPRSLHSAPFHLVCSMTHLPSSISAHHGEIQLPRRNHPECTQRWTDHPVKAGGEFSSPVIRTIPIRLQCSGLAFFESGHGKGPRMGLVGQRNGLQIAMLHSVGTFKCRNPF